MYTSVVYPATWPTSPQYNTEQKDTENIKEEKFDKINSELKKEKVKYDIKRTTQLSTESKEQE